MENEKIQTGEGFSCPACHTSFTEEDMMSVCGEPFNGAVIECEEEDCKKEWSVDILFRVTEA